MTTLRALALAIVLLWSHPLFAAEGPEAFLSNILTHDFDGDDAARIGHVFYPDGRYIAAECVNEDCGERREVFYPDADPTIIIARWRVIDVRMESKTKAVVTVRNRVVATAEGQNEKRKILPLPEPRDEEVSYRVWKRKGGWKWVEPPQVARVGFKAVRGAVAAEVENLKELIAERGPKNGWDHLLQLYQAELADLDALAPLAEANAAP